MEYPKMLFSQAGWDNLQDHVIVDNPTEEDKARALGYDDMAAVEAKRHPFHKPVKPAKTAK
jgi:hypothetical protein